MVEKAIDAKIPVIVLDRNTRYQADYAVYRRAAGEHAVKLLGGPGQAKATWSRSGAAWAGKPAYDRHDGFHGFSDTEPGIKHLLNNQPGDWKQDQAYNIMTTALRNNEKIELAYRHNDPMAYGSYLREGRGPRQEHQLLHRHRWPAGQGRGVNKGLLTATFLYTTPGAEGLRQAVKLLNGEKIPPVTTLPTMLITKDDAAEILKQHGLSD